METDRRFHALSGPERDGTGSTCWPIRVVYTLRLRDLYWLWQTSYLGEICTAVLLVFGLGSLLSPLLPGHRPPDIRSAVLYLALAAVALPAFAIVISGSVGRVGERVTIEFDEVGLEGWDVNGARDTTWTSLRHPRAERSLLVLPFSWPLADAWVPVPTRAFSPGQYRLLRDFLIEHRLMQPGARSVIGLLMDVVVPKGPETDDQGMLRHLPNAPGGRFGLLQALCVTTVGLGLISFVIAIATGPAASVTREYVVPGVSASLWICLVPLGIGLFVWRTWRSRWRLLVVVPLLLLAAIGGFAVVEWLLTLV